MYKKGILIIKEKQDKKLFDIYYYLYLMHSSGLISKDKIIEKNNHEWVITLIVLEKDNFISFIDKLKLSLIDECEISYTIENINLDMEEVCNCNKISYYVLNPEYDVLKETSSSSPLKCGKCLKQIPLNDALNLTVEDKEQLIKLQQIYNSLEYLRLNECNEEFVENEIIKYNSKYNKLLFEASILLETKIRKPVYSFLKNPIDGVYKEGKKDLEYCPICNKKIDYVKNERTVNKAKVCRNCKIILPSYE